MKNIFLIVVGLIVLIAAGHYVYKQMSGSGEQDQQLLTGTSWAWLYTERADDTQLTPFGEEFVLTISEDNRLASTTDCNQVSGAVVVEDSSLTVGPLASTKIACEGETLEADYIQDLSKVASYGIFEDELHLILEDGGIMVFTISSLNAEEDITADVPENSNSQDQVACTQDAKLCPDGSYVGRVAPNCEFAACP